MPSIHKLPHLIKIIFIVIIFSAFISQTGYSRSLNVVQLECIDCSLVNNQLFIVLPKYDPINISPYRVEEINPYFTIKHFSTQKGVDLSVAIINGPSKPPEGFVDAHDGWIDIPKAATLLPDFPSFNWVFGCSAVSAAMIAAYYDRNAYPNLYTGPTHGGVCPVTDTLWPTWLDGVFDRYPNNPLIASHQGVDGHAGRGSIEDYWVSYGSSAKDPYITKGWPQHTWSDAMGDFMKTSQSAYDNTDGATSFYNFTSSPNKLTCDAMENYGVAHTDGTYGRKLFYEERGYEVAECYSQMTDNKIGGGFSFADYKVQIDAGHPVLINLEGHSMVGFGYNGTNMLIRDTWDSNPNNIYSMPWGGSYSGMDLYSISIVRLEDPYSEPTVTPMLTNAYTLTPTSTPTLMPTGMPTATPTSSPTSIATQTPSLTRTPVTPYFHKVYCPLIIK